MGGPYAEEPSAEQDEKPQMAIAGWDNETNLKAAGSFHNWGRSFCTAHHVGSFCDHFTQVRCCRATWGGYVKCGTTVHSSRCGWGGGSAFYPYSASNSASNTASESASNSGTGWAIHRGWTQSSFCRDHFTQVRCCRATWGGYVSAATTTVILFSAPPQ